MLHIIIFQVNTFFQIDFYYVDERKTDFPQKNHFFFSFFPENRLFPKRKRLLKSDFLSYFISYYFQVNTFFQIDFYYVDERKTDFPQKKSLFFIFLLYKL